MFHLSEDTLMPQGSETIYYYKKEELDTDLCRYDEYIDPNPWKLWVRFLFLFGIFCFDIAAWVGIIFLFRAIF